jgi:exosortase D (VPLPA-CTERM-specific)
MLGRFRAAIGESRSGNASYLRKGFLTMNSTVQQPVIIWKEAPLWWAVLALTVVAAGVAFSEGLWQMFHIWDSSEEYSYGYLIPFVTVFFIWNKREALKTVAFHGSWMGLAVVLAGVSLLVVGELATIYTIVQYGFLVVVAGAVLAGLGWPAFRSIATPLAILAFMVPLPQFLFQNLSSGLQLLSSNLGVWVIQQFGISVASEGNVIDLGAYKLQVVEACSGLRYLFPLMTFGFIAAYLYKAPLWKRATVFLSAIPITVLMNSFRIGVIGVTVEYWGEGMADGFLHDFEGWIVFMACTGVLLLEMWLLTFIGGERRPFGQVFGLDPVSEAPTGGPIAYRRIATPLLLSTGILAAVAGFSVTKPERQEIIPIRPQFVEFPLEFAGWKGQGERLEKVYVDALKFDDYVMVNYTGVERGLPINFYVAYYGSQRKGQSAHSPRSCLPGGGWKIADLSQRDLGFSLPGGGAQLRVNRALIEYGDEQRLVYYWFQQRGRVVTNEYLVKWYLLWDAILRNRTDGALVRVTLPIAPGASVAQTDAILERFVRDAAPQLDRFIPK